jgi:glycosyltransferase involved in cell wall biosynthesis
MSPDYVVITPVRNEAEHIEKAVPSMRIQTATPRKWVLVDDGS